MGSGRPAAVKDEEDCAYKFCYKYCKINLLMVKYAIKYRCAKERI